MLYVLTATGFLPGSAYFSASPTFGPMPGGGFGVVAMDFLPFIYEQEKLTSYELGSKNRFLNNRLQVNGSVFYMNYEGYQEAVNILPPGQPPPPRFAVLRLPVEVYGLEADFTWLLTANDKVTLTAGWLKATATEYPTVPDGTGGVTSAKPYMGLKRIPGLPGVTADLTYDHTFFFGNGSSLVPRAELRYTSGYYLSQITEVQKSQGYLPYLYQDSVVLLNLSAS
jgi:outer membrane receptor protein involved in Fe transport